MSRGPFGYNYERMGRRQYWVNLEEGEAGFPLILVEGKEDGPTLFITAGLHGSEYTGIEALLRFPLMLELERLSGRVIALPLVNLPAFQQRTVAVCPIDGKNVNRVFPGSPHGSYSERLAHLLAEQVDEHADYVVDLHGNDPGEAVLPLAAVHLTGGAVDEVALRMALAYGLPYQVRTDDDQPWGSGGTMFAWAAQIGKPAILVQSGGNRAMGEADVALHLSGLLNLTRAVGMQPQPVESRKEPVVFTNLNWVSSDRDGIYRSWVDAGERVTPGQILGISCDYFGNEIKIELSPADGIVLYVATAPVARAGTILAGIASNRAGNGQQAT